MCALAISDTGNYIASGQVGTSNYKGNAAPIFLWDSRSCQRLAVLRGLSGRVTILAFSPDDMFLCACDEVKPTVYNNMLHILASISNESNLYNYAYTLKFIFIVFSHRTRYSMFGICPQVKFAMVRK